ncbi:MAG: hypothetical protein WBA31_08570 [Candidatus Dormiibacterota bacterium]
MALDNEGNALAYNGTSWSVATAIDASTGIQMSVSCTGRTFCVGVDAVGNALIYGGASWSAPKPIDSFLSSFATGNSLAVSCVSSSFCLAVDSKGNAIFGTA